MLLVTLGMLAILGPFGTDAFLPALPTIAEDLGAGNGQVQFTLTGFTVGMAVGQLFAGPLSDGRGRRRPILFGCGAMAVAGFGAAAAPNLPVLVACCAAMGLGASFGIVLSRAILSDLVDGPRLTRSYAVLGTLTGIGPVVAPVVGVAILWLWDWRAIFVALGVFASAAFLAVAFFASESLPRERRLAHPFRALPRNAIAALRTRSYVGGATVIWFSFGALFAYIAASAFLMQSVLGMSAFAYSIVFGLNGCGLIVSGIITARLSARLDERAIMAIGLSLQALAAAVVLGTALAGSVTAFTLLPALFVLAGSMGFIFGPATSIALTGLRHTAGTALAVMGSVQFLCGGIVSPLVELGGDRDPRPFAIVVSVCVALAWTGWVVFSDTRVTPATRMHAR